MTATGRASLADWLALHGLDPAELRSRLALMQAPAAIATPDPALAKDAVLPMVLDALGRALPGAEPVLQRLKTDVQIDLSPDPARFPRAFTLHDDGRGLPFVSCPLKGRMSDLLLVMHELGHACQSLAAGRADLPPVQRETAAYLAEELLLRADPDRALVLRALHRARTARIMARDGAALAQATMTTPYHYNWNYPIARDLAARATAHLPVTALWGVYTGKVEMAQLLRLPAA